MTTLDHDEDHDRDDPSRRRPILAAGTFREDLPSPVRGFAS